MILMIFTYYAHITKEELQVSARKKEAESIS